VWLVLTKAAANFVPKLETSLATSHRVFAPAKLDVKRDQNSLVVLSKALFPSPDAVTEVTEAVRGAVAREAGVMDGDIMAVTATDAQGRGYLVVSFHGDTNGIQVQNSLQKK
jgi:hypothetical protein